MGTNVWDDLESAIDQLEAAEVAFDGVFASAARRKTPLSTKEQADLELAGARVSQAILTFVRARAAVDRDAKKAGLNTRA